MKFYTFRQGNCYGGYESAPEQGIGLNVIIEADSPEAANKKAHELGMFLDIGCDWCDRWQSVDKYDGSVVPSTRDGTPIWAAINHWFNQGLPSFIHWRNGEFTRVDHKVGELNEPPAFERVPEGWMQIHREIERHKSEQGAA